MANKFLTKDYLLTNLKNFKSKILDDAYVAQDSVTDEISETDENPISSKGVAGLKSTVDDKFNSSDVVSAWETTTSDSKVPSEKLVKDSVDGKLDSDVIVTSWESTTSDTKLPSEKLVKTEVDKKINATDIVTSWEETTSDTKIPSEKLVKDAIDSKTSSLQNEGYASPTINEIGNYEDSDGVYHKNLGLVDLGTLSWSINTNTGYFQALLKDGAYNTDKGYSVNKCVKYNSINFRVGAIKTLNDGDLIVGQVSFSSNNCYVAIKDSNYTDAASFKEAVSGLLCYYELATPLTWNSKNTVLDSINELNSLCKNYFIGQLTDTIENSMTAFLQKHLVEQCFEGRFYVSDSYTPADLPSDITQWKYSHGKIVMRKMDNNINSSDGMIILYPILSNTIAIKHMHNGTFSSSWTILGDTITS